MACFKKTGTYSLVIAVAVMAQPISAKPRAMTPEQSMFLLNLYATCLVDRYESRAESLIRHELGTPQDLAARKFFDEKKSGYCVMNASKFRVQAPVLRGAVSETLLRRRYTDVVLPDDRMMTVPATTPANTLAHMRATADCVVQSRPALARSLFAVRGHSPQETEILKQVDETARVCAPDGMFLKLHREMKRGFLGEAQFKWAETTFGARKSQRLRS